MGETTQMGSVRKEVAEQYTEEAEKLGITRAEYVRKCVEIGRLAFRTSGEIDIERLRDFTESGKSTFADSDLKKPDDDLSTAILRNLPTDQNRALSEEEIREAVFGSKSEQHNEIVNTLKQLRQANMIESLVSDGYVKTGNHNE